MVKKFTSSARSQLITPAPKQFLRGPKDWSLKAPHLDYVVNVVTLPIHISLTTVWSSGLCGGCHTFTENEPHQLLSSNSIFQPIQNVAAVSTVSSPGINSGLSKILLLQEW